MVAEVRELWFIAKHTKLEWREAHCQGSLQRYARLGYWRGSLRGAGYCARSIAICRRALGLGGQLTCFSEELFHVVCSQLVAGIGA